MEDTPAWVQASARKPEIVPGLSLPKVIRGSRNFRDPADPDVDRLQEPTLGGGYEILKTGEEHDVSADERGDLVLDPMDPHQLGEDPPDAPGVPDAVRPDVKEPAFAVP